MSVFVDQARTPGRRHGLSARWSRLTGDDREQLHAFAARLGIPPTRFVGRGYEITDVERNAAVAAGARSAKANRAQLASDALGTQYPHPSSQTAPTAVLAAERTPARTICVEVVGGSRPDLPFGHHCGVRWGGSNTSHCGSCCRTFAGEHAFGMHRRNGVCLDPTAAGLAPLTGRAYECWGSPAWLRRGDEYV